MDWVARIPKTIIRKKGQCRWNALGYVSRITKMENVYHYTIAEFTHLFVDIGERCLSVSISHWEALDFSHERTSHALTPDHFRMTVVLHAIT